MQQGIEWVIRAICSSRSTYARRKGVPWEAKNQICWQSQATGSDHLAISIQLFPEDADSPKEEIPAYSQIYHCSMVSLSTNQIQLLFP
jgi:hypothetical protein